MPTSGSDAFVEACRWLADAHTAADPEQMVAALCETYRVLAARGWVAPERALFLLDLHADDLDARLVRLLEA